MEQNKTSSDKKTIKVEGPEEADSSQEQGQEQNQADIEVNLKGDPTESRPDDESGEATSERDPQTEQDSTETSDDDENTEQDEVEQFEDDEEQTTGEPVSAAQYKALNDKYIRLYAEFENFRKRGAKESLEIIKNASADLLEKLLPTLENFERAFDPEKKAQKLEDFEEGIKMIYRNFKDVVEESGLEEINPEGEEFDPNFHDALMQQAHDTVEEGKVIQVFQKGYQVNNKIIRHAKVIISKGQE